MGSEEWYVCTAPEGSTRGRIISLNCSKFANERNVMFRSFSCFELFSARFVFGGPFAAWSFDRPSRTDLTFADASAMNCKDWRRRSSRVMRVCDVSRAGV